MQKLLKNSTRRTAAHAMRSIGSAVPSRPFSFVLIVALALLVASCKTTKTAQSSHQQMEEQRSDSSASRNLVEATSHVKKVTMWTQPVSADTTQLEIPLDNLTQLPEGASFTGKKGRANVKVSLSHGGENGKPSILVESSCDSLMDRFCQSEEINDSLMRQIDLLQKAKQQASLNNEHEVAVKQTKIEGLKNFVKLIGSVILLLALLKLVEYILSKRNQKSKE